MAKNANTTQQNLKVCDKVETNTSLNEYTLIFIIVTKTSLYFVIEKQNNI